MCPGNGAMDDRSSVSPGSDSGSKFRIYFSGCIRYITYTVSARVG